MLAFGTIPDAVGSVTLILGYTSIIVEGFAAVYLLISLFGMNYAEKGTNSLQLFEAGKQIRNAAFCSSALLFIISNLNSLSIAKRVLSTLSTIFRTLAFGSLGILGLSVLIIVVASVRGIQASSILETKKKMWISGLLTYLSCILLSFLLA